MRKPFRLSHKSSGGPAEEDGDGHAVIQTYNPENETIRRSAAQDYEAFYQNEIAVRRAVGISAILRYCYLFVLLR